MIKSELDIEQDVYDFLKDELRKLIGGNVYKSECRPVDSQEEDAVINVSDSSADQIQQGNIELNIYVQDIGDAPDKARLKELAAEHENLCELMNNLTTEYIFSPGRSATSYAEPDIHQHFVNFNFEFERITF